MSGSRLPRVGLDLNNSRSAAIGRYLHGRFDYYSVQPGLACRLDDALIHRPFRERSTMPDRHLLLQFRLGGPSAVRYSAGERKRRLAPHFTLIQMVPGSSKEESFEAGQQDTVITLHCQPFFLKGLLAGEANSLPPWLHDYLQGKDVNRHTTHRLSPAMRSAANDLLNADPNGFMFEALMRAKSVELLRHGLLTLYSETSHPARVEGLSTAETALIERAAAILRDSFPDQPALAELAASLQLSAWKLNRGFKAIHGVTASEFIVELRMQAAQALLAEGRLSMREIAVEVGYDYLTNFSKAFKRHSGLSPRAFREAL